LPHVARAVAEEGAGHAVAGLVAEHVAAVLALEGGAEADRDALAFVFFSRVGFVVVVVGLCVVGLWPSL
jgi:hypothetical protein